MSTPSCSTRRVDWTSARARRRSAADLIADDVADSGGVVVELGGDVAVRGEGPEGAWAIAISDTLSLDGHEPRVAFGHGGIATSSTNVAHLARR